MYAADSVSVTWGSIILTGFAPGSFVTFKRNAPRISTVPGIGGGTDVRSYDNSCTCEVTLLMSSAVVADLNAAAKAGTRSPLVIRDLLGTEVDQMMCRLASEADSEFSDTLAQRKFTFTGLVGDISGGGGHDL